MTIELFPLFAIMNNAAVNICVNFCVDMYFMSFGNLPRSGIPGSYDNSKFNILRNCQTIF